MEVASSKMLSMLYPHSARSQDQNYPQRYTIVLISEMSNWEMGGGRIESACYGADVNSK
jgi:hypothetical protein